MRIQLQPSDSVCTLSWSLTLVDGNSSSDRGGVGPMHMFATRELTSYVGATMVMGPRIALVAIYVFA